MARVRPRTVRMLGNHVQQLLLLLLLLLRCAPSSSTRRYGIYTPRARHGAMCEASVATGIKAANDTSYLSSGE
eukprot:3068146-Prymnesium_polylepis.1